MRKLIFYLLFGLCCLECGKTPLFADTTPLPWPPVVGKEYPNLGLVDHNGRNFNLSEYRGKVVIIEPIGMTCPACQSFSGGRRGAHGVEKVTPTFEDYFTQYAGGLKLRTAKVTFIQLLLYDYEMKAPDLEDSKQWRADFPMPGVPDRIVATPQSDMRSNASYYLVPGFQLIDTRFILRFDATGHHPHHNLYSELLPAVPGLLRGN